MSCILSDVAKHATRIVIRVANCNMTVIPFSCSNIIPLMTFEMIAVGSAMIVDVANVGNIRIVCTSCMPSTYAHNNLACWYAFMLF